MVNYGDQVEIAFNKASPEEIKLRPNTYQLEPDMGEVVSATFTDQYGQDYNMVRVNGRLRRILTKKLKVINARVDGPTDDAPQGDSTGEPAPRHFGEVG